MDLQDRGGPTRRQLGAVHGDDSGPAPDGVFSDPPGVQWRHLGRTALCNVSVEAGMAQVEFDEPQVAVAAGQGAAFYEGDRLLGGGWIDSTSRVSTAALDSTGA